MPRFRSVRSHSERLCDPLEVEDYVVQSMPDASPIKWHLAHTTWFFETFVLAPFEPQHRAYDERYAFLFNSYYEALGPRHTRPQRGLLTRPTVREVMAYRSAIEERVEGVVARLPASLAAQVVERVALGVAHEQQHQELMLTDLQHAFAQNPLKPAYRPRPERSVAVTAPTAPYAHRGGLVEIGHAGAGFAFDNEAPRHSVYLEPFEIERRLVSWGEYRAFIEDGGYRRPELWLSDGHAFVSRHGIEAPPYMHLEDGAWMRFSLHGLEPVHDDAPVSHVSYFEADAYARWAGARLPRESEWECYAREQAGVEGHFVEDGELTPRATASAYGSAWVWTQSPYVGYPGYAPVAGALGEYNGKFMCNQWVLRGGSCFSPGAHLRATYRNFFPADARWQMTGIRLCR